MDARMMHPRDPRSTLCRLMAARLDAFRRAPARLVTAVSLALAVLLLGSAVPASTLAPAANAQTPLEIRMGVLPIFISAPMFIAQDKGYFAQAGVHVEMTTLWVASDLITAMVSGD